MNRIIVHRNSKEFSAICKLGTAYLYAHNENYSCVDVDSETFCVVKLRYNLWLHAKMSGEPYYADMPTYVLYT